MCWSYYCVFSLPQNRIALWNDTQPAGDCIVAIFGYLIFGELAEVGFTWTQIRTIARDVFSRRQKSKCVYLNCVDGRRQAAAVLRKFRWFGNTSGTGSYYQLIRRGNAVQHVHREYNWGMYCTGEVAIKLKLNAFKHLQADKIDDVTFPLRNVKDIILSHSPGIFSSSLRQGKAIKRIDLQGKHPTNIGIQFWQLATTTQVYTLDRNRSIQSLSAKERPAVALRAAQLKAQAQAELHSSVGVKSGSQPTPLRAAFNHRSSFSAATSEEGSKGELFILFHFKQRWINR